MARTKEETKKTTKTTTRKKTAEEAKDSKKKAAAKKTKTKAEKTNTAEDALPVLPEYRMAPSKPVKNQMEELTRIEKTEFFNEKIKPHLVKAKQLCETNGIPFYATACYSNSPEYGAEYYSDGFIPEANGIVLEDDRFIRHVNVDVGVL